MSTQPTTDSRLSALWAKKRTDDGQSLWLPLITHLRDTGGVINWIFTNWMPEGQAQTLIEGMGEETAEKLVRFTGLTHDLGKASFAFQMKTAHDGFHDIDDELLEKMTRAGFKNLPATIQGLSIENKNIIQHAEVGEVLLRRFGVNRTVAAVVGGHHGAPKDKDPGDKVVYDAVLWQKDTDGPIKQ